MTIRSGTHPPAASNLPSTANRAIILFPERHGGGTVAPIVAWRNIDILPDNPIELIDPILTESGLFCARQEVGNRNAQFDSAGPG